MALKISQLVSKIHTYQGHETHNLLLALIKVTISEDIVFIDQFTFRITEPKLAETELSWFNTVQSKYYGCWWHGSLRRQDIYTHCIHYEE